MRFKFIEIVSANDCYKMHRVTQEAANKYIEKNKTAIGSYEEILQKIMEIFLTLYKDADITSSFKDAKSNEYDFVQLDLILKNYQKFSSLAEKNIDSYSKLMYQLGEFYLFIYFDYKKALDIFHRLETIQIEDDMMRINYISHITTCYINIKGRAYL